MEGLLLKFFCDRQTDRPPDLLIQWHKKLSKRIEWASVLFELQ